MVKVFVAIPSVESVIDSQTYVLREIEARYRGQVELVYPEQCIRRKFHDFARNALVDEFLESDCDVLWFLDSDITPPKHVLDLVTAHYDKWQVSGATYPVFMSPQAGSIPKIVYTAYVMKDNGAFSLSTHVPTEGREFIDGLATGCLFIKREVFSKLSKPYFEFKYNPETREMTEGEDLGFCRKVNALGIKFFVDYGMYCRHQKSTDLLDINNYAIEYANDAIAVYDANIKAQVTAAVKEAFAAGLAKGKQMADGGKQADKSGLILPEHLKGSSAHKKGISQISRP